MDENKLKRILQDMDVPPSSENARKTAINLAVSEFKAIQNKKEKTTQGMGLIARLISRTTQNTEKDLMEQISKRRLMYGGMATAMAVILIAGVSLTQLQTFNMETESDLGAIATADVKKAEVATEEFATAALKDDAPATIAAPLAEPEMSVSASANRMMAAQAPRSDLRAMAKSKSDPAAVGGTIQSYNAVSEMAVDMVAPAAPMPYPVDNMSSYYHDEGRDKFSEFKTNPVKIAQEEPVSTFSVDVDTASYSFVRSQLNNGALPNKDAVRIEEMINYFDYNYAGPDSKEEPFKATVTITPAPWNKGKQLMQIGIKGYDIKTEKPHTNLVFLLDVSGSMNEPDKLPLVKNSLKMLLDTLKADDTVAIAVYAGAAGTVLEPTKVSERAKIFAALDNLEAGGSTAGAEGINLAYQLAEQNFVKDSVNRVILATDGDFNVGASSDEDLKQIIEKKREKGIFLSVLGFGEGNMNDSLMQTLAQNGNGTAAYIDTLNEARKVLVEEASSTLFPIAKDVKIQVEFNPDKVAEYRLIGYETRALNREDFNNDKVDAGDIGSGHTVTAIYEITPKGSAAVSVDPLRYSKPEEHKAEASFTNEYAFLKIRYKLPEESTSHLITTPVTSANEGAGNQDLNWATAVAGFGQILKGDADIGGFSYDDVLKLAQENKGEDQFGYRAEFLNLVRLAKTASSIQPQ